jgi:ParB family chromosome partitioning protein
MNAPRTTPKQPTQVDPDLRKLQEDLSNTIGAQVRINHRASGKGRLSVDYASLDQLEGILDRLHPGRNKDGFG